MSEFAAIIGLVVDLVAFIFNRVIDAVCLVCLLASLVFPWRWIEACIDDNGHSSFRDYSMLMFGVTLMDFIAIPFTFCIFLSPLRFKSVCKKCGEKNLSNNFDFRCDLISSGLFALFDVLRFLIGLITLGSPVGRQFSVLRSSCTTLGSFCAEGNDYTSNALLNDLFNNLAMNGLYTLMDIVGFVLMLTGIWMPSTWKPIFLGISKLCQKSGEDYEETYICLFVLFAVQPIHAFIDLVCAPFAAAIIVSPFRAGKYCARIQQLQQDRVAGQEVDFNWYWNESLRSYTFSTGFLCLSDIVMIPFLLPLWITRYRYSPIKEAMSKEFWGFSEIGLVFEQFTYFICDLLIVVPLLPILFLTRVRYKPIQKIFDRAREVNQTVTFQYNTELYADAILQFGKLIFDLLCLPFTVFVLLLFYRSESVVVIFRNDERWENGVESHCNAVTESFIILHDFIFVTPLSFLILIISPWRFVFLFKTKFSRLTCFYFLPKTSREEGSNAIPEALAQSDLEAPYNAPVPDVVSDIYANDYTLSEWRYEVWRQFFAALVDLPFFALGLVVWFSFWRSYELYYHINAAFKSKFRYSSSYNWKVRGAIWEQFLYLIMDIFCLIPFSIILGSLYKIPKLILDLYSKTLGPPLQSASIYDVNEVKFFLPETGGPNLLFFLRSSELSQATRAMSALAFDPSKPLKFQLVSSSLWSNVESTFGSSVASIGRSMFPMTLSTSNQESNYFSFVDVITASGGASTDKDNLHLLTLKLGKFKRKSALSKLDILSRQGSTMVYLQLECSNNQGAKAVLCRCGFDLKALYQSALATESVSQAPVPIEKDNFSFFDNLARLDNRSNNFVNSFSLIVIKIFFDIAIDLVYFFMFICTILNPYRFFRLCQSLFESASFLPYRMSTTCLKLMRHADEHIVAYRDAINPSLITDVKDNYGAMESLYIGGRGYRNYAFSPSHLVSINHSEVVLTAESQYLKPYTLLYTEFETALTFDGCEKFLAAVKERFDLQDKFMDLWFKRLASNVLVIQAVDTKDKKTKAFIDKDRAHLAYWILDEEMILVSKKLAQNKLDLEKESEQLKVDANKEGNKKKCGVIHRSSSTNQYLIKTAFTRTCTDFFAILLIIFIFVTLVRALPFVKDLVNNGACSITRYTTKIIVKRHVSQIGKDLLKCLKLFIYVCFICVTVVCFPSYLMDFWKHLGSLDEALECARYHFKNFWWYVCELFALVFACKSFTILLKSSLYAILVPAACITESFSRNTRSAPPRRGQYGDYEYDHFAYSSSCGRSIKFLFSFLIWVALIVGGVYASLDSIKIGDNEGNGIAIDSCKYLLEVVAVVGILLFIAIVNGFAKKDYLSPNALPSTASSISWSYILALITGPVEFIQLAAVVMFFFWSDSRFNLGTDNFSVKLLVWDRSILAYHNSIVLATSLTILWGIIVTFPVVISSDKYKKIERSRNLKKSQFYQFLVLFITRLFPVWIMATFMRASSCVEIDGEYVMSTALDALCGGHDFWAAKSSLVMLMFFIITSSILHSDDANLLNYGDSQISEDETAKFSPIYTMLVRFCQVFILAACLGGFWDSNLNIVLGIVIAFSLTIAILPFTSLLGNEVCSLPCVMPIRSAGWFSVTWTAIVCLYRSKSSSQTSFGSEFTVFIGWAAIYLVSILYAIKLEYLREAKYRDDFEVSGLRPALRKFVSVCRLLKEESGSYFANRAGVITNFEVFAREFENSTSTVEIANTLLKFEEIVSPAKFKSEFLLQSSHTGRPWLRESLKNFVFRLNDHEFTVIIPKSSLNHPPAAGKSSLLPAISISYAPRADQTRCKLYPSCDFYCNETGYCSTHAKEMGVAVASAPNSFEVKETERPSNGIDDDLEAVFDEIGGVEWVSKNREQHSPLNAPSNSAATNAATNTTNTSASTSDSNNAQSPFSNSSSQRLLEYGLLAYLINSFISGLQLQSVSSAVSRKTFSDITSMNRRMTNGKILRTLPQEVCWIVYSYLLLSDDMKKVLLSPMEEDTNTDRRGHGDGDAYFMQRFTFDRIWVKGQHRSTSARWERAVTYFACKKDKIKAARVSSGMYEVLDEDEDKDENKNITAGGGRGGAAPTKTTMQAEVLAVREHYKNFNETSDHLANKDIADALIANNHDVFRTVDFLLVAFPRARSNSIDITNDSSSDLLL